MQKIKLKVLQWLVKLIVFAVPSVGAYMVLINLLGLSYLAEDAEDFGKYGALVLLGMGAFAFVLYDICLGFLHPFYDKVIKPKIKKRMK